MNVGLVAQKGNSRAAFLAATLRTRLRQTDVEVTVDTATAEALDVDGTPLDAFHTCDLIVSIGGDGTFLFASRGANGTPILGVNLGEVGFLNAVGPDQAVEAVLEAVADYRAGGLDAREAPRLAAKGDGWTSDPATNEVVIQGPYRGHGGGVSVEIRVDGSLYSGSHADGVLVATPTGSTAYNLSEKGPLVHPDAAGLIVNEMCSTGGMPPLVVEEESEISVTITDADSAVVVSDGRLVKELSPPTEIVVSKADTPLRIAGPSSDFFEALGKLD